MNHFNRKELKKKHFLNRYFYLLTCLRSKHNLQIRTGSQAYRLLNPNFLPKIWHDELNNQTVKLPKSVKSYKVLKKGVEVCL